MKLFLITALISALSAPAFAGGEKQANVKDINKDPTSWIGKKVSLKGEVEHVGGDRTFVLDGDGFMNDRILVIGEKLVQKGANGKQQAGKAAPSFKVDDKVSLTGTVQRLTVAEIEREYSLDLDPELEIELEGTLPVIVANLNDVKKS